VNSMSDVAYWEWPWLEAVLARVAENPQHVFLFLTKTPSSYLTWYNWAPTNVWFGSTATEQHSLRRAAAWSMLPGRVTFLSAEPLHGPMNGDVTFFGWGDRCPRVGSTRGAHRT
jgi:protein gp37